MPTRRVRSCVITLLCITLAPRFTAAEEPPPPSATPAKTEVARVMQGAASDVASIAVKAEVISHALSEVVGTAISPLVGVGAIGALGYWRADAAARASLPWYSHPWCWGSIIVILLLVALKDTVGSTVPLIKKPLDALELIENKVSALIAAPVLLQELVRRLTPVAEALVGDLLAKVVPIAYAATAATPVDAAPHSLPGVLSVAVTATLATIIFFVVWLSAHVVNVLVFLNPIPLIDWLMKSGRLALIGLVVGAGALSPTLGIVVCLVVFAIALWMFGWSFRLMTLGSVCAWDVLVRAKADIADGNARFLAFAMSLPGVPARTLGHLSRGADGRVEFAYRRLLLLPRRVLHLPTPSGRHEFGEGLVSPVLVDGIDARSYRPIVRLAPRYRGQASALAHALGIDHVRDVSIARGLGAAWRWIRDQIADPAPIRT